MYVREQKLSIPIQDNAIRNHFPSFRRIQAPDKNMGIWEGELQPFENGQKYKIRVEYKIGRKPKVWVIEPNLIPQAKKLHRYKDGSLCLYYPKDPKQYKWSPNQLLATTIFRWAAEWLLLYEIWLTTKIWFGLEAPHEVTANK